MSTVTTVPPGPPTTVSEPPRSAAAVAQQHQPEVTVAAVQRARCDADPVVPDHQPDPSLVAVHGDVHRVGARVLGHVERALPGAPVEERRQPPACSGRRTRAVTATFWSGQARIAEVAIRSARLSPVSSRGCSSTSISRRSPTARCSVSVATPTTCRVPAGTSGPAPRGGEQERRAGELLDHAVVQVPGQQPALPLGSDQHGLQHPVPVLLRGRGPADQPDRHRQLGEGQHQQGQQRERHDPVGQLPVGLPDPGVREDHLQHHLAAAGQRHRDVRLDQVRRGLLLGPLLGTGQRGDVRVVAAAREHAGQLRADRQRAADQRPVVGPEHHAAAAPHHDPLQRAVLAPGGHRRGQVGGGSAVAVQRRAELRLDHGGADAVRGPQRLGQRVGAGDPVRGHVRGSADERERDRSGEHERRDRPCAGRAVTAHRPS